MNEESVLSRIQPTRDDETTEWEAGDLFAGRQAPFGWLRGHQDRCIMLELRKKCGNILAIGYSWIERAEFDASDGILLHAGDHQIQITGRNLNGELRENVRLFEGITRHRVPWIREASATELLLRRGTDVVVESIEWQ